MPAMGEPGAYKVVEGGEAGQTRPLMSSPSHATSKSEEKKDPEQSCCDGDITTSSNVFFQMTMSVTLGVFVYEGTAYNLIFLARVLPAMGKEQFIPPFLILFNIVWGLALWAYLKAYTADPGRVPSSWHDFVRKVGPALPVVPSSAKWCPGKATYCRKCSMPRPERAHHCNVSGFCVLRMDHYCPWINNCVGYNNYKFFLQLVVYGSLASFVGIATSLPELILCVGKLCGLDEGAVWKADSLHTTDMVAFLMFGSLAIFLGILLAPMLFTHVPLAVSNVTAIEGNYDNMANPYHLGSKIANLEEILGIMGPDWLLPIEPFQRKGDGVSFPRWDEPLGPDDRPVEADLFDQERGGELNPMWILRYKVRQMQPQNPQEQEFDPLKTLTQWWNGAPADDEVHGQNPVNMGCVA
eukprot:TRINITY_DN39955_c0_g1_i1.p1 TRINITY_DN39955_c0_g1~~TRINITY_DN39955_c0_g1_i1.p1  ORF type:complete len:410 (-),score=73.95 TRINITY_DN39955_c0_g1_i1:68-1297(-)